MKPHTLIAVDHHPQNYEPGFPYACQGDGRPGGARLSYNGGGHERVEKMTPKREIKAKEVVEEILSGMADDDLMQRYGLTPEELDSVLRHLVDSGFMTRQQLQEREQLSHSQIIKAFVDSRTDTRELD